MKKIAYKIDIGYHGCGDSGTIEVPDDTTDDEINRIVEEMTMEHAASWEGDERLGWGSEMSEEEFEQETEFFYENVSSDWHWVED